jgi:tRNA threonylcarbamoyladenosine biosynthesis protein TsaE
LRENGKTFISRSPDETAAFFHEIGRNAASGDIYALYGGLGAGKTLIASAIARGMGISDDITSPTFTLLEIYEGPLTLYHFDLYRINDTSEFDNLFFDEYWGRGVSVIELAERAAGLLPEPVIKINIVYINENTREITVEYPDI